ncbi:SRPBCC family protein [Allosphingosinicella indica]|uniref:SRPBCC domain-containing protein n=1 Tax=Allosphingosinicella indica TaxID=941907 RepID=A0A1X7G9T7_9SPHN|nr:hypothetical protein [Allosphingosinicella indica]SMF66437.1 hypothetical protein SAMN06295910_1398 [Allosphingosinicella indica]
MTGDHQDRVLTELAIAAPADAVWQALRDKQSILRWFGWDADTLDAEVDMIFAQYGREEGRTLHFEGTQDRFEVTADGADACLLRVVRAAPGDSDAFDEMAEGWISFGNQLKLAIEQHGLAERRTLYFSGALREGQAALLRQLGIAVDTLSPQLPTGDETGSLWHRTPFQVGLTMPGWGHGLLIAMDMPADAKPPNGAASAILTTYGLDDATFAALAARWKDWWDERFDSAQAPACE